ncbi:MAG: DUF4412 domain-containing protein [Armatimonadota bacterium]
MKIRNNLVVMIIGILLTTGVCSAAEFSANVSRKITNPKTGTINVSEKIYVKGIIRRQEIDSPMGKWITIIRPDKGLMWMLISSTKSYTEMENAKVDIKAMPSLESMIKKKPNVKSLGTEKVSGYVCNKYKYTDTKNNATGTIWISTKLQQEIKSISKSRQGSMTTLVSNIKEAKQPDSLFTIPKGYKKQEMPMPPGTGGGIPGGQGMPGMPSHK